MRFIPAGLTPWVRVAFTQSGGPGAPRRHAHPAPPLRHDQITELGPGLGGPEARAPGGGEPGPWSRNPRPGLAPNSLALQLKVGVSGGVARATAAPAG